MALTLKKIIAVGALALAVCMPKLCEAANYYVDYVEGNDANNGAAITTPFKHCPGDSRATATVLTTVLGGGDTVIFKGGVSYVVSNHITLSWSGSSDSSRIVYDGNSAGTWGTGKAIITDNHGTVNAKAFYTDSSRNYITFKNFDIKKIGGSATLPADPGYAIQRNGGGGIRIDGGSTGITIDNCNFSEIGYYFNKKPMSSSSVSGVGVQLINANNVLISNCDFTKVNMAIEYGYDTTVRNINISNCSFHNYISWCIDFAGLSAMGNIDFIDIYGCSFYDYAEFDKANWQGYGEWPHTDGIYLRIDYDGTTVGKNNNIRNNKFYQTTASAGGSASISVTNGASVNIFNNFFIHSGKTGTIYLHGGKLPFAPVQEVNIFNNTFFEDYQFALWIAQDGTRPPSGINVKNNIFYDYRKGSGANRIIYIDSIAGNWNFDSNIYKSFNTTGYFYEWVGVESGGLSKMKSRGWEANGIEDDPLFVDISYGVGSSCYLNNFQLQPSSPARNAGTLLPPYFVSILGAGLDMGAYEYKPNVPKGVHILNAK